MATKSHYSEYVADKKMIDSYKEYQKKYKAEPRESDKFSINLFEEVAAARSDIVLLDIACSTGNFLRHLCARLPFARLTGADLSVEFIRQCKEDPELAGIDFRIADLLTLPNIGRYDVVTANAVTYLFDWSDYKTALKAIADTLNADGAYIGFELINPFSVQDLTIIETSEWNPDGLTLRIRPKKKVENSLKEAGFDSVDFYPFLLPIDLPNRGFDADGVTYTRKDENGERLAFRGALFQPWCHFVARKAQKN